MSNSFIKDHRSLFRQLLAGMYDAVLITDPSGHLIDLNARGKEYFQYDIDEVMDTPIGKFVPGVSLEIVQRIRDGLEKARHMMLDANCMRKDGTSFPAEVTVSMIDLMNPGDLVFTIRNTERRRGQLDAFRTKEHAYEVAQSALFACGAEGRFRFANPAFLEMFDIESEDELQKTDFAEIFDDEPIAELFARALTGETDAVRIVAEEEGGDSKAVEIRLAPDRSGKKIIGVVGSVTRA